MQSCTGDGPPLEPGKIVVRIDPRYLRPSEVDSLVGDAGKARAKLGWAPRISFEHLVQEMADADFDAARRELLASAHGRSTSNHRE